MLQMIRSDFCMFILSHGRANNVVTVDSLLRHGYTGKFFIVIDDEDKQRSEYEQRYGDKVLVFSKAEVEKTFDVGDNFPERRAVIWARNACFELAAQVNCKYFMQLDDDYIRFQFRFDRNCRFGTWDAKDLDEALEWMIEYYDSIPALSICLAQGGDFIGGTNGGFGKAITAKRKAMNTFLCRVDRPFKFVGRINEDVNTYTSLGHRGSLFLTLTCLMIVQKITQSNAGGMSEMYLASGTYIKSFYSVMYQPSSVKISDMGEVHRRIHHSIDWETTVPQIIRQSYRKPGNDNAVTDDAA